MKTYELHNMLRYDIEILAANDVLAKLKGKRTSDFVCSATERGASALDWYIEAYRREEDFWAVVKKGQGGRAE